MTCCLTVNFFDRQAAFQSGEDEVGLATMGRAYTIEFHAMQQINEDTGTSRAVQRKQNPQAASNTGTCTSAPDSFSQSLR